jgi:hypothetical protein
MTSPVTGASSSVAYEGALADVYSLLSEERTNGLALGQTGVEQNREAQAKALDDQLAAIKREEDNQRNSGDGLLGSIGKLVSDVVNDLVHGDATSTFKDVSSDLEAAWNSPHFWSDLQTALTDVSVVGAAVSQVAEAIGGPCATAVAVVASTIDQGAELGADLAGAREECFAAAAKSAEADATSDKASLGRLATDVASLVDAAKANDQSVGRALDDVAGAIETSARTLATPFAVRG